MTANLERTNNRMSTISSTPIVIDGKGHLLGRLASVLAKQVSLVIDSWKQEGKDRGRKGL